MKTSCTYPTRNILGLLIMGGMSFSIGWSFTDAIDLCIENCNINQPNIEINQLKFFAGFCASSLFLLMAGLLRHQKTLTKTYWPLKVSIAVCLMMIVSGVSFSLWEKNNHTFNEYLSLGLGTLSFGVFAVDAVKSIMDANTNHDLNVN